MESIAFKNISLTHHQHPHFFEFQYEPKMELAQKALHRSVMLFENKIILGYYKFHSITYFSELLWEYAKRTNPILSLQDMVLLMTLLCIILFYVLEDYTAFSSKPKRPLNDDKAAEEKQEKQEKQPEQHQHISDKVEITTTEGDEAASPSFSNSLHSSTPSLMLHRNCNPRFRHKKRLPDDHYFMHYKRFSYCIEEGEVEDDHIIHRPNYSFNPSSDLYSALARSHFSLLCMAFGVSCLF